ncbi:hypothetical protein [Christiangramia crocea]|uniref:Uncharacterized protein n=1 Tax=Christiangramia crocea TaxID=2904124 RepID=A0A9X2A588_9FLAO|nr:hypothetical protein [Gramella crocea]MCG9971025.1 hypothetical protein [Gramella crocea]
MSQYQVKKDDVLNCYNALKDLKKILEYTPNVNLTEYANKNDLNNNFGTVLKEGGILEHNGIRGVGSEWKWVSKVEPSRDMAKETLKRINQKIAALNKKYSSKKTSNKKENKSTSESQILINTERLSFSITKLLWGLISVKTIYHYDK